MKKYSRSWTRWLDQLPRAALNQGKAVRTFRKIHVSGLSATKSSRAVLDAG